MEYTSDLENRVQQGKNDTNPLHDVMKLRIDKGKYLYIVPRSDGRFEFCSNDATIQAKMQEYKTQVLKKKFLGFKVLDRVKSDFGITDRQPENTPQTSNAESEALFIQSRLANELKKLKKLDIQALNQQSQRLGYDVLWQNPKTYTAPHSNPSFKGNLILRDRKSGKDYVFTSDMCDSKKEVQRDICTKIFLGIRSNSNTLGKATPEQQAEINRIRKAEEDRLQQEREKVLAEQNRFREQQNIFEEKKQQMLEALMQEGTSVEAFKEFKEAFNKINKAGSSIQFYTILDDIIEKHPEITEPITKTFVAAYGFAFGDGREERSGWNSEAENFFLGHQDCIKYVQEEFDAFIEPYKQEIAQWKALDEQVPALRFYLDINDGAETDCASYHTFNKQDIEKYNAYHIISVTIGSDFHPVDREYGRKIWENLDVLRDKQGKKIDEKRNYDINKKIANVFGMNLYQEAVPTVEQKQYAQELVDNYKKTKELQEQQRANQERMRIIKAKKIQNFMSENSISGTSSKEDMLQAINQMTVVPSEDNANQSGFNRKYIFRNRNGNKYELNIIDNQDKTLSVQFGPFSFSAELTSVAKDYAPDDGTINRVFEHHLKQAVHAKTPSADAIVIDATLRKVGILGHPNTIKKKIKEGELSPVEFSLSAKKKAGSRK